MWFYLDPDFRRDAPKTGAYCVRCQKAIANPAKAMAVTVNWDWWSVTKGGPELMGADCWKKISVLSNQDKRSKK